MTYLDTTTASKSSNGRLCDTLDVIPQDLPVTLRTTFAEALATFTASSHIEKRVGGLEELELGSDMEWMWRLRVWMVVSVQSRGCW